MQLKKLWQAGSILCVFTFLFTGCAQHIEQPLPPPPQNQNDAPYSDAYDESKYISHLPQTINLGKEKVILVDPKIFAWGAYDATGNLIRGGVAAAGADYCPDDDAPCRTKTGTFRINSLGGEECFSKIYPRPDGGSLMPYCMFFHKGQALHGSPDRMFAERHVSHGCVNIRIPAAEWIRNNFAKVGTKVVILPY